MSTSTSTPTGVRTALPKVNLLPTEISEGAKFRNLQAALGLSIVLALGVVGILTYLASGEVSDAQDQLTSAQTQTTQLQAEIVKYAEVPKRRAQVDLADAQLAQAMGQEVRYSFILRDLSLTIPRSVYLDTLTVTQPVDTPGSVKGAWGGAGVTSIVFHGTAPVLNDVAAWLDSLTKSGYYSDPYVNAANRLAAGSKNPFQFDSSVVVTDKQLTHKYDNKGGN